ncbi:hypothetical protein [Paracoccus simplex]|uniref:Uncharacterized protein n=1 Tax=Paracoccus simplex TaxID=2086346 RepID=A0ABV7RYT8_9RHOB
MTLINHRRGSRNVYHFDLVDDHDQPADTDGVTGELRVCAQDVCTVLPINGDLDVDLQPLDGPSGDYVASLYLDWGEGLIFEDDIIIRISEGC